MLKSTRLLLLFSALWRPSGAFLIAPVPPSTCSLIGIVPLFLAKKKKQAAPASKKIQVKMLKSVSGTGQKGDVVMVTPAFFNNKLRPTSCATIISDKQVSEERATAAAAAQEFQEHANHLKQKMEELELIIKRRAGPDGNLFGGVGAKCVMEEVHGAISDDFLNQKHVKIKLEDEQGKALKHDIKETGKFCATVSLTKGITAKLSFQVEAE